ncbi:hypothetical protein [Aeribacillus pallidus]|uniref:hypothetical protein n=1 Tax=Aeribacillus pallidus TaxID=33936 RepID=UPI003D22A2C8
MWEVCFFFVASCSEQDVSSLQLKPYTFDENEFRILSVTHLNATGYILQGNLHSNVGILYEIEEYIDGELVDTMKFMDYGAEDNLKFLMLFGDRDLDNEDALEISVGRIGRSSSYKVGLIPNHLEMGRITSTLIGETIILEREVPVYQVHCTNRNGKELRVWVYQ